MKQVMTKIMQVKTTNLNIVKNDFVKMVAAAFVVGLTFSAVAVAVSLMLAYTSTAYAGQTISQAPNARWVSQQGLWVLKQDIELLGDIGDEDIDVDAGVDAEALAASPGHLLLDDGCASTPLIATERDWQITINGDVADVQVMQTFVIPVTGGATTTFEESGHFGAVLPRGAIYTSFRIQTRSHELLGQYAGHTNWGSWDKDDAEDIAHLKSRGLVRVYENLHGSGVTHVSSDSLHGLTQGETVVVTYRYLVPVDNIGRSESAIRIALHDRQLTDDARNSVWINWVNTATQPTILPTLLPTQPRTVISAPRGLNIERTPNGKRIIAASYENIVLPKSAKKDNNQFQLRWAM